MILFFIIGFLNKKEIETIKLINNQNIDNYTMDIIFDDESKRLTCNQTIDYINKTGTNLDKIYLHIYPNAFSKKSYAPFESKEMDKAYPNGFNEGYINIQNVVFENSKLDYNIIGEKNDILEIELNSTLDNEEIFSFEIKYIVKIPNSKGRFGYGENTINITNWFPIMCVYDDGGWNTETYSEIGDPFYSNVSNFNVNILSPSEYELVSTGKVISSKTDNEKTFYEIEAKNVRDFAFLFSNKFIVNRAYYDNIEITTYNLDNKFEKEALDFSVESIKIFSKLFGEYPYDNFDVVASDFFIGGMEYPNLVMIDESLYDREDSFLLEYVIAHETAHQWWYGVIGNDQVKEPWLDEALTEYSTILYFEHKYGRSVFDDLINSMESQTIDYVSEDIFKSINEYRNSIDYSLNVYTKGALAFNEIRNTIGDEKFFEVLREYYDTYKFENVNSSKFVDIWHKNGIDIEKIISEFK